MRNPTLCRNFLMYSLIRRLLIGLFMCSSKSFLSRTTSFNPSAFVMRSSKKRAKLLISESFEKDNWSALIVKGGTCLAFLLDRFDVFLAILLYILHGVAMHGKRMKSAIITLLSDVWWIWVPRKSFAILPAMPLCGYRSNSRQH